LKINIGFQITLDTHKSPTNHGWITDESRTNHRRINQPNGTNLKFYFSENRLFRLVWEENQQQLLIIIVRSRCISNNKFGYRKTLFFSRGRSRNTLLTSSHRSKKNQNKLRCDWSPAIFRFSNIPRNFLAACVWQINNTHYTISKKTPQSNITSIKLFSDISRYI
jgi:hypothetical protein